MALFPLEDVEALAKEKLLAAGCDSANATSTARWIYLAERDGSSSHGLFRLPGYIASIRSKKINPKAQPKIDDTITSVIRVDAQNGMAPLANELGIEVLCQRAKEHGVALLSINNSFHFSALWIEAEIIAKQGLTAMCFTAHTPMVAPYGGNKPLFSTNPMAFAWPREHAEPMVFDQATAAMARGDIQLAAINGEQLPDGIGVDAQGTPTNDPREILKGAQLPFGGYKGSNIALMIELLVGPMINDYTSLEAGENDNSDGGPARGGELMIAIDPNKTAGSAVWSDQSERFFNEFLAQDGTFLPGDRRRSRRQLVKENGILLADELLEEILSL